MKCFKCGADMRWITDAKGDPKALQCDKCGNKMVLGYR